MNTIVILILILSLLIGFFIWKNISNRRKKNEEIKKQNLINNQRIEKLKKEKAREDFELLLQKNVECDDGKTRIYSENMYGILSDFPIIGSSTTESGISMEFGSNSSVFEEAKEIVVDSNDLIKMEEAYELRSTQEFDHKIKVDSWFSPTGVCLSFEDILNSKQNWENHRQNYTKKYSEILNRMRFSMSKPRIIKLLKINDYLFLSKSFIPFNGKIDEVKYINGKKVE